MTHFLTCFALILHSSSGFRHQTLSPSFTSPYFNAPLLSKNFHLCGSAASTDNISTTLDGVKRRAFLLQTTGSLAFLASNQPALAEEEVKLTSYQDKTTGIKLSVPSSWATSTQEVSGRRKIDFFVDTTSSDNPEEQTLLFIAFTPVRDDFTGIGSFGTVEDVGQTTILPKGEIAGAADNESRMLNSETKKGSYFFDYTVKVDGQAKRHLRTIFTLILGATGGAGNVLVTVTAQSLDSNYGKVEKLFDQIFNSYASK